jgi:hypothetical protein
LSENYFNLHSLRLTCCCNNHACRADSPRHSAATAGSRNAGEGGCRAILLAFRAESAHEKDDKAYQQNQANSTATDDGTTKVKPAATEQ